LTEGPRADATADSVTRHQRETFRVAGIAAVIVTIGAFAFAFLRIWNIQSVEVPPDGSNVFTYTYVPPANDLERVINISDGQAWATLAHDPSFSHPERFTEGTPSFVYRAQRPLFGLLVWAGSAGQPGAVAGSLLVITCLGVGALAFTSVLLADQQGRVRRYAALAALMPGSLLVVVILGPEPLAVALAVLGVYWWLGPPRRVVPAVALLAAAGLMRDTLLMVPAGLLAWELVRNRSGIRDVLWLLVPPAAFVAWVLYLRVRWATWPWELGNKALGPPFAGWIAAIPDVQLMRTGSFVLAAVLLGLALWREPWSPLTWIAMAFALSTIFYGVNVLGTEAYRPLLAMYVFAFIAVLPRDHSNRRRVVERRSGVGRTSLAPSPGTGTIG
jgi:hypothetical protein